MNIPVRVALSLVVVLGSWNRASSQTVPTAETIATAQNAAWYLNGDPIAYAGNLYYPTGPRVYFNRFEMVRSGFVDGVPFYTKTTIEPYSMVFVPIGGGLMQPYERRRAGDVAGTVGSTTPSFPGTRPFEQVIAGTEPEVPIAPAPPTGILDSAAVFVPRVTALGGATVAPVPVGTSGSAGAAETHRTQTADAGTFEPPVRKGSPNAPFIEFEGRRWFSRGPTVMLDRAFKRVGEYHGLPVYSRGGSQVIYVPVQREAVLLARYARR